MSGCPHKTVQLFQIMSVRSPSPHPIQGQNSQNVKFHFVIIINAEEQVSNKWKDCKKRFHLNGHIVGICLQT